jgi:hypothetical protein
MAAELGKYGSADGADGADGDSATSSNQPAPASDGDISPAPAASSTAAWEPAPSRAPGSVWADVRCYNCGQLKAVHRSDYEAGEYGSCLTCQRGYEPIDPARPGPAREPAGALL